MTDKRGIVAQNDFVYDTVAHSFLSPGSSSAMDPLEAVMAYERSRILQVTHVSTWACPCSCPYCYVGHQLRKGPEAFASTDLSKLIIFLDRQLERRQINSLGINLLGGEPTLGLGTSRVFVQACRDWASAHGVSIRCSITTSLAARLDENDIGFLCSLDLVTASIDGDRANHDAARGTGKFDAAIRNLKKLVSAGARVNVQAALPQLFFEDEAAIDRFLFAMFACGLKPDQVTMSGLAQTEKYDAGVTKPSESDNLFTKPCCSYRFMAHYMVFGDDIFANFFDSQGSKLGSLSDDYEAIRSRYVDHVMRMPVLNDPGCADCPVLGFCWGHCFGDSRNKVHPSRSCNRAGLTARIKEMISTGEVSPKYKKMFNPKKWISEDHE